MAANVRTVPAAGLVLDHSIYPRHSINDHNVSSIARAIEAGVALPIIVAEEGTNRVVDGWHRIRATLKALGTDATIMAEFRTYPDEASVLEEAIRLNADHGARLTRYDMARCSILAQAMGLSEDRLAGALHLTRESVRGLVLTKTAIGPGADPVAIKATLQNRAGSVLSDRQIVGNRRAGGMSPTFYINQVVNLIENDLIDWQRADLVAALHRLAELLDAKLAATI